MQKGDVYEALWGYDQTNVDFIQVEEVSPTGKSALCRMMGERIVGPQEPLAEWVIPGEAYGEPFRLRVKGDHLVGTYPFVKGGKRFDYFWRHEGKPILQTHYH